MHIANDVEVANNGKCSYRKTACLFLVLAICFEISAKLIIITANIQIAKGIVVTGQQSANLRSTIGLAEKFTMLGIIMALVALFFIGFSVKCKEVSNVITPIVLTIAYMLLFLIMV